MTTSLFKDMGISIKLSNNQEVIKVFDSSIKLEYIQLNVSAVSRGDAVRKAANPLVKDLKITQHYVDKIIEIMDETGPYIVITPHVALAHAPIEDGALHEALGITILKEPIIFGNRNNDPVKYIFVLSAEDNERHLKILANLVSILGEKDFYLKMKAVQKKSDILEIFENITNEGLV